jgi:hypothetical protein
LIFTDPGGNALEPDNDPDFFFEGKPGELSAALGFCLKYRSGCPIVHTSWGNILLAKFITEGDG